MRVCSWVFGDDVVFWMRKVPHNPSILNIWSQVGLGLFGGVYWTVRRGSLAGGRLREFIVLLLLLLLVLLLLLSLVENAPAIYCHVSPTIMESSSRTMSPIEAPFYRLLWSQWFFTVRTSLTDTDQREKDVLTSPLPSYMPFISSSDLNPKHSFY